MKLNVKFKKDGASGVGPDTGVSLKCDPLKVRIEQLSKGQLIHHWQECQVSDLMEQIRSKISSLLTSVALLRLPWWSRL